VSRAQEAKRRGAKLIAIDPTARDRGEVPSARRLLPGTDGAFALGVMHVLIREGWLDRDYIERHTLGFDALAARAAGLIRARGADLRHHGREIEQFARRLLGDPPGGHPAQLRHAARAGGGNAVRAVACLPALAGHWRRPRRGMLLSTSGNYPVDAARLYRPDLLGAGRRARSTMSTIGHACCMPIRRSTR